MLARRLLHACLMEDHVLVTGSEARHDIDGHVLRRRRLCAVGVSRLPRLLGQHLLGRDLRLGLPAQGLRTGSLIRLPLLTTRVAILRGGRAQVSSCILRLHEVLLLVYCR